MQTHRMHRIGWCLVLAFSLLFVGQLAAQEIGKEVRHEGRITRVSKDASTITIQAKAGIETIAFDKDTKFTYRNKPGTIDDVKEGRRVICLLNAAEKSRLLATRIDVREGK
jgi:hypothetical protein